MIILILFAFLGGVVTILSPCILPILPIVLSGSITGGKRRPLGVVTGFIASFTFFTLFLSAIVKTTGLSADNLRLVAVLVITLFGLSLVIPTLQERMGKIFSRLAQMGSRQNTNDGYASGILVGLSLGLVWTPCVGPILASIITLAATANITIESVIITLAYSLGTAIPLLAITYGGRNLLNRHPWLLRNTTRIQKGFGILMLFAALGIFFSWDRKFQIYILEKFPNYGSGLTRLEDTAIVTQHLKDLKSQPKIGSQLTSLFESNDATAPKIIAGGAWINSKPLTMDALRGKVVLVDFWTYTCINCIRTLPYIKSWHETYKDKGLVIIGVHTPEFEFEKNLDNVAKAVKDFGLQYPVVQDNDYATWQAYDNHYWPAKYLIDKNGKIRNRHFGEGSYDETESWIQKLLKETGATFDKTIDNPTYPIRAGTPETYLGYSRISGLASPERIHPETPTEFSTPAHLGKNQFAFSGTWTITSEHAIPTKGATLTYHFDAAHVFLVMRPQIKGSAARVRVLLDGSDASSAFVTDVRQGIVTIDTDRLYTLVKLNQSGEHVVTLEFLDDNAEVYAFTFG